VPLALLERGITSAHSDIPNLSTLYPVLLLISQAGNAASPASSPLRNSSLSRHAQPASIPPSTIPQRLSPRLRKLPLPLPLPLPSPSRRSPNGRPLLSPPPSQRRPPRSRSPRSLSRMILTWRSRLMRHVVAEAVVPPTLAQPLVMRRSASTTPASQSSTRAARVGPAASAACSSSTSS
jgi:hypothetical protein